MANALKEFKEKIMKKKAKIAVVGLGYVGLPLAVEFAKANFSVLGLDVDKDRVERIKKKTSYITDISTKELRKVLNTGKLSAGNDFRALQKADIILICVPTPLKRKYTPDVSFIKQAVGFISRNLKKSSGVLIILESTTYPGTTEEMILPLLESHGLRHGRDFHLAFSPERIDPGNKAYPLRKISKIVGGIDKEATEMAKTVYQAIIEKVVPVSSAKTAELVKLLENTFRLVNIGLIDELTLMAHKMKVNIWEVIDAAKTKPFGFMPFYPGPGVGGHCIPKDPLYLYWKARHHGFSSRFIRLASEIISSMPAHVVSRAEEILGKKGKGLKASKVLVVGVTYKKDVNDLRKSPSLDIIEILQQKGTRVSYFDPYIPYLKFQGINLKSIDLKKANLGDFDCVIIGTDHTKVNYDHIYRSARRILDTRNIYKGKKDAKVSFL